MPASPALSSANPNQKTSAWEIDRRKLLEKSFRKCSGHEESDLAWVGKALWRAIPEARSEHELSEIAAELLSTPKATVTPRTVRNWVRGVSTPHFRYVRSILVMAGAEAVFNLIDAEAA